MAKTLLTLIFSASLALIATAQERDSICDATIDPAFELALFINPILAATGGADVVQCPDGSYFVAIGVTSIQGSDAKEQMRQLKVGRMQAIKAIAEFIQPSKIDMQTTLHETTEVITQSGKKSGNQTKELTESTRTTIEGMITAPPQVGVWKSKDRQLFFYAVGKKLTH